MLLYTTGDASGQSNPDKGETFAGLLPADIQRGIREAEGVMTKGQVWEEMQVAAEAELPGLVLPEEI